MAIDVQTCRTCLFALRSVLSPKLFAVPYLVLLFTLLLAPTSLHAYTPASDDDGNSLPTLFMAVSTGAVNYGGSASATIILSDVAPSDVTFQLSSDIPAFISVSSPTITIPQGQNTATFTFAATGVGTATITAAAPGYGMVDRRVFGLPDVPMFAQPSGLYPLGQLITITSSTPGAIIHYTVDGSTPNGYSPIYSAPIPLTGSETIQAYAYLRYINGPVGVATYSTGAIIASMTISSVNVPNGGTSTGSILLASPAPTDLNFALASSNPSIVSIAPATLTIPQGATSGIFSYTGVNAGIVDITGTAPGVNLVKRRVAGQPVAPTFVQPSGAYSSGQTITITDSPGSTIFYTTDGTNPTTGSSVYRGPLTLLSSETIQAIALAGFVVGPASSATYTVGASQLNFTSQLPETTQGAAISPSPTVQFQDASGNTVPLTAPVTLSLGRNASNSTLGGRTTVNAINGIATFPGITVSNPGTGYTLIASSPGYTSDTSNPFTIDALAPTMSISVINQSINTSSLLTGTITLAMPAPEATRVNLASTSSAVGVAPSAIVFAAGQSTAPFSYVSLGTGASIITATATGYTTASTQITSTDTPNPATYYVANAGDDGNDGLTPVSPFQTLARVNQLSLAPGSAVYLQCGSTFRESLTINRSGALNNHIFYSAYGPCNGSNRPLISGADLLSSFIPEVDNGFTAYWASEATAPALVFEDDHRLLLVKSKDALVKGSYFFDDPNNRVYVRTREDAAPALHRIEASVRSSAVSGNRSSYITLSTLEADKCTTSAIVFAGNLSNVLFTNVVTNYSKENGIYFTANKNEHQNNILVQKGVAVANSGNGVTKGNGGTNIVVSSYIANYNGYDPTVQFQGGIRIISDNSSDATRPLFSGIENSSADFNGINPDTGASVLNLNNQSFSGQGVWCDTCGNGSFLTGNEGHGNTQAGAELELTGQVGSQSMTYNVEYNNFFGILHQSQSQRDLISNNTTYGNFLNCLFSGEYGGGEVFTGMRDNIYQNNICASRVSNSYGYVFQAVYGAENNNRGEGSGNIYRYNSFGAPGSTNGTLGAWGNVNNKNIIVSSYADLDADYGSSTNSIEADPLFTNPAAGDFSLKAGSPAIGAGYEGVDLGAIPYQP